MMKNTDTQTARRSHCSHCHRELFWSVNYLTWFHYINGQVYMGNCPGI